MANQQTGLDWIDERDENQVSWAAVYLRNKGWRSRHPTNSASDYFQLVKADWHTHDSSQKLEQLTTRMKAAWSKQVSRKRRKSANKSYSFEMSPKVGAALKRLSAEREMAINHALEGLILNTYEFRQQMAAKRKMEEEQARAWKRRDTRMAERMQSQLNHFERLSQDWEDRADTLLAQGARFWVALKAHGLLDGKDNLQLNPHQEETASKLHARWIKATRKAVTTGVSLKKDLAEGPRVSMEEK